MNRLLLIVILVASAIASTEISAAVISRDWKTPGDGLLTFDTVNKREWLDLSQTILSSQFPGSNRDQRYQYVVSQTAVGGLFQGFMVAKSLDITAIAQSSGINTAMLQYATNARPTTHLIQLFGTTVSTSISTYSVGMLNEYTIGPNPHQLGAQIATVGTSWAGLRIGWNDEPFVSPPPGVFLFRAVPEPGSILGTVIGIAIIAASQALRRR